MAEANWQCPSEWSEWSEWLAAGLHARNRWRLPVLLTGILFATGRRTVSSWLRAAGVSDDFCDYYYFLTSVGHKTNSIATQLVALILRELSLPDRLLLVIDDAFESIDFLSRVLDECVGLCLDLLEHLPLCVKLLLLCLELPLLLLDDALQRGHIRIGLREHRRRNDTQNREAPGEREKGSHKHGLYPIDSNR